MKSCCNGCTGTSASNHPVVTNRPGLSALRYRIGTYETFFAAMKARLSGGDLSFPPASPPLAGLKVRDQSDPAIALLDAWAVLADVLTFYQERIANESYLRTATERQSIVALASLIGATLRPGVSASTYLAYTIDPKAHSSIPAGSKVQSIPGPGELPQSFETSEDFAGNGAFSNLSPRLSRPQVLLASNPTIYLSGLNNNVNVNDPLLLVTATQDIRRVAQVNINTTNSVTAIGLQSESSAPASFAVAAKVSTHMTGSSAEAGAESPIASSGTVSASPETIAPVESLILGAMEGFLAPLAKPPSSHPATPLDLKRRLSDVYQTQLDTAPKLVRALHPEAADEIYPALATAAVTPAPAQQLFAFRIKAPVYGHNAPLKPITNQNGIVIGTEEWPLNGSISVLISINGGNDSLQAVFARDDAKAFVSVTQANTSSSGMLTIPKTNSTNTTKIGPWDIKIASALSNRQHQITITFPGLNRLYTITLETQGLVHVVTDGPSVVVPIGQSGTSDASGRHLLVSTVSGLLISDDAPAVPDQPNVINLDSVYDKIMPGSWIYLERSDSGVVTQKKTMVKAVAQVSLNSYGIPARVSQLTLEEAWLDPQSDRLLTVARNTTVYAQSELLPLAEEPITDPIAGNTIELEELYSDLQPGRWLIVSGERADIPGISGILAFELVMLAAVKQGVTQMPVPQPPLASINFSPDSSLDIPSNLSNGSGASTPIDSSPQSVTPTLDSSDTPETLPLPGDTTHSFLQLASPLAYSYKRETVTVYGNVVPATNGETRKEVLGSGDSSQAFQQFQLHASPLTYVSRPTVSGAVSTLAIYVNGIQWHEVDTLMTCGPTGRIFVTSADEQDTVTITFGDGIHGMRLPTGQENVQAIYRVGIGSGGNLDSGKLSQLSTRPLGVRAVINPMASTGGADRDSSDAGRRNIPLASIALDRLVSVSDYASFARTFAGIGKATSAMLSDKHRQIVVVSVSGAEGSVIAPEAQVVTQLTQAFQQLGDPYLPVAVLVTNPLLLVISAQIKLLPDYQWINVAPLLRASLLAAFSFDAQVPGAPVYLSAVTSVIQQVAGVEYCIVDGFSTISHDDLDSTNALQKKFAQLAASTTVPESIALQLEHADSDGKLQPSTIAFLNPDVPDALLLTEIAS